jgi:hypothetical protein
MIHRVRQSAFHVLLLPHTLWSARPQALLAAAGLSQGSYAGMAGKFVARSAGSVIRKRIWAPRQLGVSTVKVLSGLLP